MYSWHGNLLEQYFSVLGSGAVGLRGEKEGQVHLTISAWGNNELVALICSIRFCYSAGDQGVESEQILCLSINVADYFLTRQVISSSRFVYKEYNKRYNVLVSEL